MEASEKKTSLDDRLSALLPMQAGTTPANGKFLVDLVNRVGHKQAFFALWFLIVAGFVLLMAAYYKKQTRRNFREPRPGEGERNLPPLSKRGP